MTCRHKEGDPACTSGNSPEDMRKKAIALYEKWGPKDPPTPDCEQYTILDVEKVGEHLVLKVQYRSCSACSYEGTKVLVFLNCTMKQALMWKRIDPHFRAPQKTPAPNEAPSPAARFPASDEGWGDALWYAGQRP